MVLFGATDVCSTAAIRCHKSYIPSHIHAGYANDQCEGKKTNIAYFDTWYPIAIL